MKVLGEDSDLTRRALAAYWKAGKENPRLDQPENGASHLEDNEGRRYVVLSNVNGTLAVYRLRNDGQLKRLKRWPKEIESL